MADLSRRQALQLLGGGVAAAAVRSSFVPARAAGRRGRTVAVFGGGLAGLTAAHELAERGFDVSVFEPRQWGGKVRTFGVPGTGSGGRAPLPAEHAIHIVPGGYINLQDTLRRIPFRGNPNGVYDNLVPLSEAYLFAHADDQPDYVLPSGTAVPTPSAPNLGLERLVLALLPPHEAAWVIQRLAVWLSSSDERRFGEWEQMTWWDFMGADELSPDAQKGIATTLVQNLAGQPAKTISARAFATFAESIVWWGLGRSGDGPMVSHFDRPKNEAFIQPWVDHLASLGARLHLGWSLRGYELAQGRVAGAQLLDPAGRPQVVRADYYVSALPVERVPATWSPAVLDAAPELATTSELNTLWSNSVMLYLRRPVHFNHGQTAFMDSPWALMGAPQAQFWARNHDFARDFGDGTLVDCVSMAISDWDTPGVLYGKPARECSRDEIAREIWAQMQRHCNRRGEPKLADDLVARSYVDPGLVFDPSGSRIVENHDPLHSATVGSWPKRPGTVTGIPNLILAGDWVRNECPVAAQDAANESGKRAAATIVADAGVRAEPVRVTKYHRPPELEALKRADARLALRGLPHALDRPELVHGVGLATDILQTVERVTGLKVPKART